MALPFVVAFCLDVIRVAKAAGKIAQELAPAAKCRAVAADFSAFIALQAQSLAGLCSHARTLVSMPPHLRNARCKARVARPAGTVESTLRSPISPGEQHGTG